MLEEKVLRWQSSGGDHWDSPDVPGEKMGPRSVLGLIMEMKRAAGGGFRRMCILLNVRVRHDAPYQQADNVYLRPQGPINLKRALRV